MKNTGRKLSAVLVASAFLVALTGCENKQGPAERAGKEVDKAVEKAGRQIEKVGDSIQDAAKDAKK